MTGDAGVSVSPQGGDRFLVEVRGPATTTTHTVRVTPEMISALGWAGPETDLLRESFDFLLEREPQTSILRSFDLDVITRYFPEYPRRIRRRDAPRRGDQSS